jgi:S-adenosylmethionine:tRNA ribosyltransferase-isomerase
VRLADFDFALPPELIAQHPVTPRDGARMLVVGEALADRVVRDLPQLLRPGDVVVHNDTKVIKARLVGWRGAVEVEATLIRKIDDSTWGALAKPGRRLRVGDVIDFAPGAARALTAELRAKGESGEVTLAFNRAGAALMEAIEVHGRVPLPPYIKRADDARDPRDDADYQTIWAARPGAVAAPTAGFHFTPVLVAALEAAGVRRVALTLHVGAGTFLPVKSERVEDHRMHAEWGEISAEAAATIERARRSGGRVVAIGTTALRLMESVAGEHGDLRAWSGTTRLFVLPGYRFRVVDLLLTNFHLPRSTLFMLVAAFAGLARMQAAYRHAIAARYRFFSYGDCTLLRRAEHP